MSDGGDGVGTAVVVLNRLRVVTKGICESSSNERLRFDKDIGVTIGEDVKLSPVAVSGAFEIGNEDAGPKSKPKSKGSRLAETGTVVRGGGAKKKMSL